MKSSSRALGQRFIGFGADSFQLAMSRRAAFGYALAIFSVAAALAIKLIALRFGLPYPVSSTFLAAIAVAFWFGGTGPGVLALLLSFMAFGYFVLPYQIDYRILLPDGSTKTVYMSTGISSHLSYFAYFAVVALLMSWFSSSRRRAERLLSQARSELEIKVEERTAKLSRANEELQTEIVERKSADEKLRTSEQKYRDLINASPDAICVIDADGKCILVNPAGVDLAGRPEHELIASSVTDTYVPEELHLFQDRIEKLKAEGSLRFERNFVRGNGDVIPVEVSLSTLRDRHYQAIIRDISHRKRREALLAGENRVLEMVAKADSLADILDNLCLLVE